ncbi:MAG: glycosyltransferase [Alphaproteobacteria bacterium]|nr:glycosyltransferase [Alphaproteobacteria bacterium]
MAGVLAAVALGVWLTLIVARGRFWLERVQPASARAGPWPDVVAVVPARNEAPVVGHAIVDLLSQDYPGRLDVILLDDESTDGTAAVAWRAAAGHDRLVVAPAGSRPAGWTGKLWAVHRGLAEAQGRAPDATWVWLTDADIEHGPRVLADLVSRGEAGGYDLVSLMARLRTLTLAERALMPAYVFFFAMLYPFAWVHDRHRRTAAAAGGCMLVRRAALNRLGGVARFRGAIIDDCALARAVKAGGAVWLGLADASSSLRGYPRARNVAALIARSAYAQLGYRSWLVVVTVAGMALTYLAPPLLALGAEGWPRVAGALAWSLMAVAYAPTLARMGVSLLWGPALPLIALFYVAATVGSAVRHHQGRGGAWKGRFQAPRPS